MLRKKGDTRRKQWRTGALLRVTYLLMIQVHEKRVCDADRGLANRFGIREDQRSRPHITLYGGFSLVRGTDPVRIREIVAETIDSNCTLRCSLDGWIRMKGRKGGVIAHQVVLSRGFSAFYNALTKSLLTATRSSLWIDREPGSRIFHITVGLNLKEAAAAGIWEQLCKDVAAGVSHHENGCREGSVHSARRAAYIDLDLLSVTLFRNARAIAAFDLPSGCWIERREMFRKERWEASLRLYRHRMGLELDVPVYAAEPEVFFASDLHFGHENIIKYCGRPFSDANEMDRVLIRNWNCRVRKDDGVYFLGDMRYGPGSMEAPAYLRKLHGRITCISGNHDTAMKGRAPCTTFTSRGVRFVLGHDPEDAPYDPGGWVVHGHHHNNDLREYPFFDPVKRRINVSMEVIGYQPVSLSTLLRIIGSVPPVGPIRTLQSSPFWDTKDC